VRDLLSLVSIHRPRIVLEIAAFSRYSSSALGEAGSLVFIAEGSSYLRRSFRPPAAPRMDRNLVRRRVVSDKLCKPPLTFGRIPGWSSSLPPFPPNFSLARIIVADVPRREIHSRVDGGNKPPLISRRVSSK